MNPSASGSVKWKIPSLKSHILAELENNHSIPFLALTETWLKPYISDAQVHIPGYSVSRSDRHKRVGGGVALYSHHNIPVSEEQTFDDGTCQVVFCRFDAIKTCIAVVYRPPKYCTVSSFSSVLEFLNNCLCNIDDSYKVKITGDLNFPDINWETNTITPGGSFESTQSAEMFISFIAEHFYNQYVLVPTRNNNILDLFITNNDRLVTQVTSTPTKLSDHNIVDIMLSYNPLESIHSKIPAFDENSFRSLDFHKADFDAIEEKIDAINWDELRSSTSFEQFPVAFTETLLEICKECVPPKKVPTGRPKQLHALRRKRKRLEGRISALEANNGNPSHITNVKNKLALVQYDIKDAINKDLERKECKAVEKIKSNPKYFYSYAKSLSKTKSSISMLLSKTGDVVTDTKQMTDILHEQFQSVFSDPESPNVKPPDFPVHPVEKPLSETEFLIDDNDVLGAIKEISNDSAPGPDGLPAILLKNCARSLCRPLKLIWNESLECGTVPKFYKESHVSPLYKKGDRTKAINYRPVALTSHVIKVYERILRVVMVKFIDDNDIICNRQHGFRKGRSCLTQLLSHFDEIMLGLTNGTDTDSIYLDFAKAFDKVDHRLLISKLQRYGFHPKLIKWLDSFLTGRSQRVVLGGIASFAAIVISGVPQGTVLGPLLFILFINDMEHCIKHSSIRFFADDTRIQKRISCESDVVELQDDLDSVIKWSIENNMALHEDKFELLVHMFAPKSIMYEFPFISEVLQYNTSNGNILEASESVKDLGVLVSPALSWSPQINRVASRARAVASWVLSAFKARDRTTMLTLYKSLIRSHLEYCCPLWNPHLIRDIQVLEGVQRTFTSKIWGVQHLDYWARLQALNLMSLQHRRECYIIMQVWKILNDASPNDLKIKFTAPSRNGIKALVPPLNKASTPRNQAIYDRSFAVIGPQLWNLLPGSLHLLTFKEQFKIKLTEFLKSFPDTPPVSGYSCVNSNSILDWRKNTAAALQGQSGYLMTQ